MTPLGRLASSSGTSRECPGNYLSILYLTWAYILSAQWVELLNRSADHKCNMAYTIQGAEVSQSDKQCVVEIDIGGACEEEASKLTAST